MSGFDPVFGSLAELEKRTLLVSASAGSGKTWTIAHLACRWLLEHEGADPCQVLMVTFSRSAAAELKTRLRTRLVEIEALLKTELLAENADEWLIDLSRRPASERQAFLDRVKVVLPRLDEVSARTIHSFAAAFGESGSEPSDATSLRLQAVREVLTRAAMGENNVILELMADGIGISTLIERLSEAVAKSAALGGLWSDGRLSAARAMKVGAAGEEVAVGDGDRGREEQLLEVIEEIQQRLRDLEETEGSATFDSLIAELYREIAEPEAPRREQLVSELRDRYHFVLIDEFQDTDAAQWEIFRQVFDGHGPLVIVGDPKQAIYGFRGGDVAIFESLLQSDADRYLRADLTRNFRSKPRLLAQLNGLFLAGEQQRDAYWQEEEAEEHPTRSWAFSSASAAVHAPEDDPVGYMPVVSGTGGDPGALTGLHVRDLTVVARLRNREGAPIQVDRDLEARRTKEEFEGEIFEDLANMLRWRSEQPGFNWDQVAILARKNELLERLAIYLNRCKIPAALASSTSVFESAAASELRKLLWALCEPMDVRRTRLLDLESSWFRGLELGDLEELALALRTEGGAALARSVISSPFILDLLPPDELHRSWTDLEHLFDLLTTEHPRGVAAEQALRWLDRSRVEKAGADDVSSSRRIERGGGAITLMTIHSSKGLEFPIVLIPQIAVGKRSFAPKIFATSSAGGISIDLSSMAAKQLRSTAQVEERVALQGTDEAARMMYVALTRAKEEVWAWVSDIDKHELSDEPLDSIRGVSLWRMLLESAASLDEAASAAVADRAGRAGAEAVLDIFDDTRYAELAPKVVAMVAHDSEGRSDTGLVPAPELTYRQRRWSYSGLGLHGTAAAADEGSIELESIVGLGGTDEEEDEEDEHLLRARARLFGGHAGKDIGVAVHSVLEELVGVAEADDTERIKAAIDTRFADAGFPDVDAGPLVGEFQRILAAQLGPVFQGRSLGSFQGQRSMISSEMRFTLPLRAAGDQARDVLQRMVDLVLEKDPSNRYHAFFARLRDASGFEADRLLTGFLEGSLDLVVQLGEDPPRFVVMDYKTNTITDPAGYTEGPLDAAMVQAGYPLQALFYSVALHRFLQQRLPGYRPGQHLGGVSYFFLRAVADAEGVGDGIVDFSFRSEAIEAISLLLAGGA
jgi:exodeoxyribonuclease V beta subunit